VTGSADLSSSGSNGGAEDGVRRGEGFGKKRGEQRRAFAWEQ